MKVSIASLGSVIRDAIFFTLLFYTIAIYYKNKHIKMPLFVHITMLFLLYICALIFFSESILIGILGLRNIIFFSIIVVVILSLKSFNAYRILNNSIILLAFILSIFGILDYFTLGEFPLSLGFDPTYNDQVAMMVRHHLGIVRANGGITDALNYGYLMVLMYIYILLLKSKNVNKNIILNLLIFLCALAVILSLTRGAILALFIVTLISLMVSNLKMIIIIPILLFFIGYGLSSLEDFQFITEMLTDRFLENDKGSSISTLERMNAWDRSLILFLNNPLLPLGLGTQGAATAYTAIDNRVATDNSFFWILLETGFIGIVLIIMIFCLIFIKAFLLSKGKNDRIFVINMYILLVIAGWLSSAPMSPTFAIAFWMFIGIYIMQNIYEQSNMSKQNANYENLIQKNRV